MKQGGLDVAKRILAMNQLDRKVVIVVGEDEDYFNPATNTISLNRSNQNKASAAIAIAIHEVGHALQFNSNWGVYNLRCKFIVMKYPLIYITALLVGLSFWKDVFGLFAITSLISLILCTVIELIVEINASVRGCKCYREYFETNTKEMIKIWIVLGLAAFTYFVDIFVSIFMVGKVLLQSKEKKEEERS